MEAGTEISDKAIQPVLPLRPGGRNLPEVPTVPDLSEGIGPSGCNPRIDEGELVEEDP